MARHTSDFEIYREPLLKLLEHTGWPTALDDDVYYYSLGSYVRRPEERAANAASSSDTASAEEEEEGNDRASRDEPKRRHVRRLMVARHRHVHDTHHGWFAGHQYVVFEGSTALFARLLESAAALEEGFADAAGVTHKRYLGRNGFSCKYDFYHWHGYPLCRVDELARLLRTVLSPRQVRDVDPDEGRVHSRGFFLTPAYPYPTDDWKRLQTALARQPPRKETLYKLVARKRHDRHAYLAQTRLHRQSVYAHARGERYRRAAHEPPPPYLCEVSSGAPMGMPVRRSAVDTHTALSDALPPLHVTLTDRHGARTQLQENVLDALPFAQCRRYYSVALSAALWSLMPRGLRDRQLFYASNLSLDSVMTAKQPGSPKFVLERRYLTETVALGRMPSGETYVRVEETNAEEGGVLLLSDYALEAAVALTTAGGGGGHGHFGVFTSGTMSKYSTSPEFLVDKALLLCSRGLFVCHGADQWRRVCNVYYAPIVIEFAALLAYAPCVAPGERVEVTLQFVSVPCEHKSAHERYRWHVYHSARPQTPLLRDLVYRHYMSHVVSALLKQARGRPLEPSIVVNGRVSARLRQECCRIDGPRRLLAVDGVQPRPPEDLLHV